VSAYPKTENLFERDPDTKKLVPGALRNSEYGQIQHWWVTEKIDGTNIRIDYDLLTDTLEVKGRTDAASLPKDFISEAFPLGVTPELCRDVLLELLGEKAVDEGWAFTAYGEGYGPGIQKNGGRYAEKKSLALFDVVTYRIVPGLTIDEQPVRSRGYWRPWSDVKKVAAGLRLHTVPVLGQMHRSVIEGKVKEGFLSALGDNPPAEGVIARTDPYLFTWDGKRAMFKLKTKDLQ